LAFAIIQKDMLKISFMLDLDRGLSVGLIQKNGRKFQNQTNQP
jgi:hypothetical protein